MLGVLQVKAIAFKRVQGRVTGNFSDPSLLHYLFFRRIPPPSLFFSGEPPSLRIFFWNPPYVISFACIFNMKYRVIIFACIFNIKYRVRPSLFH